MSDANAAIAAFEAFEARCPAGAHFGGPHWHFRHLHAVAVGSLGLFRIAFLLVATPDGGAVDLIFALMLFVFEPLGIHRLFRTYALREKDRAFALASRLHWAALVIAIRGLRAALVSRSNNSEATPGARSAA